MKMHFGSSPGERVGAAVRAVTTISMLLAGLGNACAAPLTFDDALALAARDAPSVTAARLKVVAARHVEVSAGELPDPRLAVGVENYPIGGPDAYSMTRDPMTMQRVALTQELPNSDKRAARSALARARVARGVAEQRILGLDAMREAALAWARRYSLERQITQLDGLDIDNRLLDRVVRARLAAGGGLPADIVLPRQEAAALAERREELQAQRSQAIAALARWVGPAAAEPLAGEPRRWTLDRAALEQHLHRHPELVAFDSTADVLDAEVREAESTRKPDWALSAAYQRRGQQFGDMVSLQLSVDLPLFPGTRQDPQIAARRATREALDAEREAVRREHAQRLAADLAEIDRLDKAIARSRDTLAPLATQRIELSLASYAAGKGPLADVIAARQARTEVLLRSILLQGEVDSVAIRLHFAFDAEGEGDRS